MSELPIPIRDFILELTEDERSPAYLMVSAENTLSEWGGDCAAYGIDHLEKNIEVGEHISFLHGLLPLENKSLFMPNLETRPGQYADVYLFQRKEVTWILLLDATADATKRQQMQQKAHNLSIRVADMSREEEMLYEAQSILEEKVRERTKELGEMNLQLNKELSERKRIEAELRESESRFRRLSESNLIGIMFWDVKGKITEANDAFLEMLGYTREDLAAGKIHWDQVTRTERISLDEQAFAEMRDTGACKPFEREFIRKDGTRTSLLFGAALLEGSQTKIACFALSLDKYR